MFDAIQYIAITLDCAKVQIPFENKEEKRKIFYQYSKKTYFTLKSSSQSYIFKS